MELRRKWCCDFMAKTAEKPSEYVKNILLTFTKNCDSASHSEKLCY